MTRRVQDRPALKTKTLPEDSRDGNFEGPDPVTWIRIFGTAHEFELPRNAKTITIGSAAECDVVINSPYISRVHCTLERGYDAIRVEDRSKNGTWVAERLVKEPKDVRPGETFAVAGGVTFLALNDEMHAAYPVFSDILDWEELEPASPMDAGWPTPSKVIVWAAGNDHLLITGERGCDHARLARAIHSVSAMRARDVVWADAVPPDRAQQKELLTRASRSTLVLTIDDGMPVMDDAFRTALFSPSYRVRVLVLAPSLTRVLQVLGPDHSFMRRIDLRPLAFRTEQLLRLLDRQLEERGANLRATHMTESNRAALRACEWRGNFDDLRLVADRLVVLAGAGSLRAAAAQLGMNYSTLQKWFTSAMGLSLPLVGR
jgi:FHA domain